MTRIHSQMSFPLHKILSVFSLLAVTSLAAPAAAQTAETATLDLSPVAARTVCQTVTADIAAADRGAANGGTVRVAANAPKTQLRLSRVTCVRERIMAVSPTSGNIAATAGGSGTIGYIAVRETRTVRSARHIGETTLAHGSKPPRTGALRTASATVPAPAWNAPGPQPQHPEMLPRDPRTQAAPDRPGPGAFDFVATPREVSYTPAPGDATRFDPEKRNGNLRKGVRWLTHLITGEER